MKSLVVPLTAALAGGIVAIFLITATCCRGSTLAAALQGGVENATAQNPRRDGERSTSTDAKNVNQHRTAGRALDIGSPGTWEGSITEAQKRLQAIAQDLITVVRDDTQSIEVRRNAIFQLGRLDDNSSLEFLIKSVAFYLPMEDISGDDDQLKLTPCRYTLAFSGNWKVGQLVLESLDIPKSARERIYLAFVLESCLGKNVALAAVEEQLSRSPRPISAERRQNLEAIKTNLVE